jgi:hypothetical protein
MRDDDYRILSDEALVVSGRVPCWHCHLETEVICLYCQSGFIDGEATLDFSISNVSDIDEPLRRQLARWPGYRPIRRRGAAPGDFANHCAGCDRPQDDFFRPPRTCRSTRSGVGCDCRETRASNPDQGFARGSRGR